MKIVGDNIHLIRRGKDGKPIMRNRDVVVIHPAIYGPFMNKEHATRVLNIVPRTRGDFRRRTKEELKAMRELHNPTTLRGERRSA